MIRPTQAVFLGFLAGICILLFITAQIALPIEKVSASSNFPQDLHINNTSFEILSASGLDNCNLPEKYPQTVQQWCHLIRWNAIKYNIEINLLAAVILQESGGNPDAYSKSGAVGLMQVMPKDGIAEEFICINGPCFATRPTMSELFDPDFNLDYGARMLSNLYQRYGNWRDTLMYYGPMDIGYSYADIVLTIYDQYQ